MLYYLFAVVFLDMMLVNATYVKHPGTMLVPLWTGVKGQETNTVSCAARCSRDRTCMGFDEPSPFTTCIYWHDVTVPQSGLSSTISTKFHKARPVCPKVDAMFPIEQVMTLYVICGQYVLEYSNYDLAAPPTGFSHLRDMLDFDTSLPVDAAVSRVTPVPSPYAGDTAVYLFSGSDVHTYVPYDHVTGQLIRPAPRIYVRSLGNTAGVDAVIDRPSSDLLFITYFFKGDFIIESNYRNAGESVLGRTYHNASPNNNLFLSFPEVVDAAAEFPGNALVLFTFGKQFCICYYATHTCSQMTDIQLTGNIN